jgi:hypothetical protein
VIAKVIYNADEKKMKNGTVKSIAENVRGYVESDAPFLTVRNIERFVVNPYCSSLAQEQH